MNFSRVGVRRNEWEQVIGKYGEKERNNNGNRLLESCTIYSDHYLLAGQIKKSRTKCTKENQEPSVRQERIKFYRLQQKDIADKYEKVIEVAIENDQDNLEELTVEQIWHKIKTLIVNAAKETCGVNKR
ncbi:hypothetical protein QE152_g32211 [Popillia japonica]|uniref:Uncharacterized protein n=1 Tax=Popillia japonica TaxID=7064 RepID=A0AAW1J0G3_POPJA